MKMQLNFGWIVHGCDLLLVITLGCSKNLKKI